MYFKFLERDGNRGLGLLPLYSLDWIGLDIKCYMAFTTAQFLLLCLAVISRPRTSGNNFN